MTHRLRIRPEYFEAIRTGRKPFELRRDDRGFQVGDLLELHEWDGERYTGRMIIRRITYALDPCVIMDCEPGYLVLGLGAEDRADKDLIHALRKLSVETGSLACLGCGYEHSCGVHGCAIIREAADRLETLAASEKESKPE